MIAEMNFIFTQVFRSFCLLAVAGVTTIVLFGSSAAE